MNNMISMIWIIYKINNNYLYLYTLKFIVNDYKFIL